MFKLRLKLSTAILKAGIKAIDLISKSTRYLSCLLIPPQQIEQTILSQWKLKTLEQATKEQEWTQ